MFRRNDRIFNNNNMGLVEEAVGKVKLVTWHCRIGLLVGWRIVHVSTKNGVGTLGTVSLGDGYLFLCIVVLGCWF
jgi:hypothetical protein